MTERRKLRVAVLGRTEMLLQAASDIRAAGHDVPLVATWRSSPNYVAGERDFQEFAESVGATFIVASRLDAEQHLSKIKSAHADIAISMNWPFLVPASVRREFPLGVFNAHPGDLPRYRGNACPNWAILNNEPHVGVCVHEMSDDLDAGAVAARSHFPLNDGLDVEDVYRWLRQEIPALFVRLVETAACGEIELTAQPTDPALSLRCFPRSPEDSLVDWKLPASSVVRLIRASTRPFAGAYTFLNGRRVSIWKASAYTLAYPWLATPGQVMLSHEGDPVIACGNGCVRLNEATLHETDEKIIDARPTIVKSLRNRLVSSD